MWRDSIHNVMTTDPKEDRINVRVNPQILEDFRIAARLRGASMSGLIHQFIVRTIREEKLAAPEEFVRRELAQPPVQDHAQDQAHLFSKPESGKKSSSRAQKELARDEADARRLARERLKSKASGK